jgi:hypothetical protein
MATDTQEQRLASIESRLARIEERLAALVTEFAEFRAEIRTDIREIRSTLHQQFLWVLGVIFTMWVTVILAIVFRR